MRELTCLSLFSGIGGPSLGFQRAGIRTIAFCECEPHARAVLAKNWPGVPCYDDICTLTADRLIADGFGLPDVIEGGFPCQDVSAAARGKGLHGERSGLWFEYLRIINECRPLYVEAENSPVLRSRGLDEVLWGLASIGYDAEWHCVPIAAVGTPHLRDRLWVLAYPRMADRDRPRLEIQLGGAQGQQPPLIGTREWAVEPGVGRVAYGVPHRVDRITRLGNASSPAISEAIGRAFVRDHGILSGYTDPCPALPTGGSEFLSLPAPSVTE